LPIAYAIPPPATLSKNQFCQANDWIFHQS